MHRGWECKTVLPLWQTVELFLIKLNRMIIQPSDYTLEHLSRKMATDVYVQNDAHWKIVAVLFVVFPKWKWPRCPSAGEWLNCGPSIPWNITLLGRKKERLLMRKSWVSGAWCLARRAKRLPLVWFLVSWSWCRTVVLQTLSLGETGWRVEEIPLHYFL